MIETVAETDLPELLPLMRAYCDFYEVAPADAALLEMSRALIADPERTGIQLIARDAAGGAIGFATVFWTWQTLEAAPQAVMNDLYVIPEARGSGIARELIDECARRADAHGANVLAWQTAHDNHRAQTLYNRTGAVASSWLNYRLRLRPSSSMDVPET
ncbi:unannotated protein [freshwater metagenome]|uniref:Unannotated protein n=1 Tax=freshwater metagenome TaxID=449393 RepID=A0A6J7E8T9_9ZZZZ|nr:GNAT family N-acetyltransferase [Actinomycetota bacterium]